MRYKSQKPHGDAPDDPSPASSALDRQPDPGSTKRRTTSCAACRKQKIKCELLRDRAPCERCKRRNIECVINNGLRNSILDNRKLAVLGRDLTKVQATLEVVCQQLGIESSNPLESAALSKVGTRPSIQDGDLNDGDKELNSLSQHKSQSPSYVPAPVGGFLTKPDGEVDDLGHVTVMASCSPKYPDLISKGLITFQDAEVLVNHYFVEMDPILYGFVKAHKTTQGLRDASPTLIAAICTVSALYLADYGYLFEICYHEYKHAVSAVLFERHGVEHIRALVIGSFWLPGPSRVLVCDAARRAVDARLCRYIDEVINGLPRNPSRPNHSSCDLNERRDRVRLCYGMFMSDQHQSILNNREASLPPYLDIVDKREEYLESEEATNCDLRLVAQFSLLLIMTRTRRTFASKFPTPLPASAAAEFRMFSAELNKWAEKFQPRFRPTLEMGNFPPLAFRLHHLFGELYIGHHVFRGRQKSMIPKTLLKAARAAYEAAVSIFRMIIEADGLLGNLWKVPGYIHVMICFAGHLILELCIKHCDQLHISVENDYHILSAAVSALANICVISHHPLSQAANALRKRLFEFAAQNDKESLVNDSAEQSRQPGRDTFASVTASDLPEDNALRQPRSLFDMDFTGMQNELIFTTFGDFTYQNASTDFM